MGWAFSLIVVAYSGLQFQILTTGYSLSSNQSTFIFIFVKTFYMQAPFSFKKKERLKSKILIDQLFSNGHSFFTYPFKVLFIATTEENTNTLQVLFSVPKRSFKQAVRRNLIKRRMREAYRLNKNQLYKQLQQNKKQIAVIFIYVEKEIKDFSLIEKGMIKVMKQLLERAG